MEDIFDNKQDVLKQTDIVHILKSSQYYEEIMFKDIKEY